MINHFVTLIALCLVATPAFASVTQISSTIPYANDKAASEEIRQECDWNQQFSKHLVKASNGHASVSVKAAVDDLTKAPDKKLMISILQAHAFKDGSESGRRWVAMSGNLIENNIVIGNFKAIRQTSHGLETCPTLNRLGKELASDVFGWLVNPTMDALLGDDD